MSLDHLDLLGQLGWSTSQGDAAVAGAAAAAAGEPVSSLPSSWWASSCAHPWQAGWVATSVELVAPPSLMESRRSGHTEVVLQAHGAAATLAVTLHADLLAHRPWGAT